MLRTVVVGVQDARRLKELYPGRVLSARYEDVAERPLDFAARLFRFAGLTMDSDLRQFVWNITSSHADVQERAFRTTRSDSSETAAQWRQEADFRFVASVDALKECADLYRLAGYLPLANEQSLRDSSVPYYRDWRQVDGLWTRD